MADPKAVFAGGTDARRQMIERCWPELYNALAGLNKDGKPDGSRAVWCVLGNAEHHAARVPAVARITRMGHPACAEHVAKLADRPGGWPLAAEENLRRQ